MTGCLVKIRMRCSAVSPFIQFRLFYIRKQAAAISTQTLTFRPTKLSKCITLNTSVVDWSHAIPQKRQHWAAASHNEWMNDSTGRFHRGAGLFRVSSVLFLSLSGPLMMTLVVPPSYRHPPPSCVGCVLLLSLSWPHVLHLCSELILLCLSVCLLLFLFIYLVLLSC